MECPKHHCKQLSMRSLCSRQMEQCQQQALSQRQFLPSILIFSLFFLLHPVALPFLRFFSSFPLSPSPPPNPDPLLQAIFVQAAATFKDDKEQRGRKLGWRKTSKAEDVKIFKTFKKARPAGHGIDARTVHAKLPAQLKRKVGRRTVIRRLADRGFKPKRKIAKNDYGPKWRAKRYKFTKKWIHLTGEQWKTKVQGVGDVKHFTYYPKVFIEGGSRRH